MSGREVDDEALRILSKLVSRVDSCDSMDIWCKLFLVLGGVSLRRRIDCMGRPDDVRYVDVALVPPVGAAAAGFV